MVERAQDLIWLVILLPLAGSVLLHFAGRRIQSERSLSAIENHRRPLRDVKRARLNSSDGRNLQGPRQNRHVRGGPARLQCDAPEARGIEIDDLRGRQIASQQDAAGRE